MEQEININKNQNRKPLFDLYKVKDESDNWKIETKVPVWNNTGSLRLALIAPTGYGKTSFLTNMMLNLYLGTWKPENIYIFSGSGNGDLKMKKIIEYLEIPESNIFEEYDEEAVKTIYDMIRSDFDEAVNNKEKPEMSLFIFDDIGFSGSLKKRDKGAMAEVLCNGRKFLVSTILLVQRVSQLSTTIRTQLNGCTIWLNSNREFELLANDFDFTKKKKIFKDMYNQATLEKHNFLTIDMTTDRKKRYSNSFQYYFEY